MKKPYDTWANYRLSPEDCPKEYMLALNDALNVFTGKWKLHVIGALTTGRKRFSEIEKFIPDINPRMLSKELKDLEINGIVSRTVQDPGFVEYELTKSGREIKPVFDAMITWGLAHRQEIIKQL
ncbi:winged helix-turn-helix transcriptional regulator [Chitinophaga qingshengii]|uniref:Helix-turn-helix transcriptional regulator n=1 Tax=Chitinophaga qingshengii TaxID=1569794 RepID=A0ABR7TKM0_9BACT|nr:helix-turn-helix domain-containing protein [Chitinophaga qingshengii]MBC9931042.1 helix-turn-helix transcriptional regulator [Chitinophaga qingshengii]